MKILLSWLNEYGDFADPADADAVAQLSDTMSRLGLPVDDVRHVGDIVHGVVTAEVERLEQHPDAAKVQRVYVDAGDGIAAARVVWRVQHGRSATSCRWRRSARRCPTVARSSGAASSASTRRACSARPTSSASATTTAAS